MQVDSETTRKAIKKLQKEAQKKKADRLGFPRTVAQLPEDLTQLVDLIGRIKAAGIPVPEKRLKNASQLRSAITKALGLKKK